MDVFAWTASESVKSIALEIETGKSDVVSNVKRDLLEDMNKVIVVAVDKVAFEKVQNEISKAAYRVVLHLTEQGRKFVIDREHKVKELLKPVQKLIRRSLGFATQQSLFFLGALRCISTIQILSSM